MDSNQQYGAVPTEGTPLPDAIEQAARRTPRATPREVFTQMDADLIRVIEDLAFVLIDKGVLSLRDLPPQAQAKLLARRGFRERIQAYGAQSQSDSFVDVLDATNFGQLR